MERMTLAFQDQENQVTEGPGRVVRDERGSGGWQGQVAVGLADCRNSLE